MPEIHRICTVCNTPYKVKKFTVVEQKFCSTDCKESFRRTERSHPDAVPDLASATIGAIAELVVGCDLLRRGWHVFRALSSACLADLIAIKGDRVVRVEVRSGFRLTNGKLFCNKNPRDKGRQDVYAVVLHKNSYIEYVPNSPDFVFP